MRWRFALWWIAILILKGNKMEKWPKVWEETFKRLDELESRVARIELVKGYTAYPDPDPESESNPEPE